ncbi:MAG: 5-oxopent-3-ene-1,2,5-tricarboxylate decarboxylase [Anaerolinea sp.]|nr:5-oxopent-3-ene-1,2,5-tricarboxylate decarboxylase [Anaerolinea sp.]
MQLFSYLANGQQRCARLVGQYGIDLNLADQHYSNTHGISRTKQVGLPSDLQEFFALGESGFKYAKTVTDWALRTFEKNTHILSDEVVFEFSKALLIAPIIRPGKVICIAGNFPAQNKMECPEFPTVFLKPSGGVIGHQQPVIIPSVCKSVAYEVELVIVIGKQGKNLSEQAAVSVVAGYTLANDLGDRLLEKRTSQWTSGKMFDTFTPMGPIVVTVDELYATKNLQMYTKVNDKIVQKSNTSEMFFNVSQLVAYLSTLTTLECGDVILTGSPKMMDGQPNPSCELIPGDVVEVGIENLASLINPILSE